MQDSKVALVGRTGSHAHAVHQALIDRRHRGGLLAGCASPAEEIHASYVSPIAYESLSCTQLREEAARVSAHAAEAAGVQNEKARNDAIATAAGVVVFLPALLFIKGDGAAASDISRLKGDVAAIEQASARKNCGIAFRRE